MSFLDAARDAFKRLAEANENDRRGGGSGVSAAVDGSGSSDASEYGYTFDGDEAKTEITEQVFSGKSEVAGRTQSLRRTIKAATKRPCNCIGKRRA